MTVRKAAAGAACLVLMGIAWAVIDGVQGGQKINVDWQDLAESPEESRQVSWTKPTMDPGKGMKRLLEQEKIRVEYEGKLWEAVPAEDGSLEVLVSADFVKEGLKIGVLEYPGSEVILQQGETVVNLYDGRRVDEKMYLPLDTILEKFGYGVKDSSGSFRICLEDREPWRKRGLPAAYDYRKTGRSTRVRNQGSYGTCWSFASLTALETALRPRIIREFSADHMSLHNGFSLNQRDGGEYTMSMAYLLGWQGPVLEEEDPYGDQFSPDGLKPSVHVQEIRILPSKDYQAIKEAVFFTGGVQSSMYTSITDSQSRSVYYNEETNAYCYQGDLVPNHDVVIVGWDDRYPKENFQKEPEGNGAFLCVSSWGEEFGDQGYFYVSYYDTNIGISSLVYTGIEPVNNYDHIYQSDLCGWVGQVGYGSERAFGANVYRTRSTELLRAVGFYATGENTSYEISLVRHVGKEPKLEERKTVARGVCAYSGFYTVSLDVPEELEAGERFAVILEARTPGAVHPIAMEYRADDATADADITDGESYISHDGTGWVPVESRYQCNLCLKAYTDTM